MHHELMDTGSLNIRYGIVVYKINPLNYVAHELF
jgi:hypothetical protein